jgi:hypothetical protein
MTSCKTIPNNQAGFGLLMSVLILGAVGIALTTSLILLGIGSARSSATLADSVKARAYANACAEEALQKLRESVYYTGSQTLTFSTGTCQIQAITGVGNTNRTVSTLGTVGTVQRKLTIVIATIHPTINLTSWQDTAN